MTTRLQHHRRRGRQMLCWAIATFCAAQLATGVLLDWVWPDVRFPDLTEAMSALGDLPRSPDVVCVGSSRIGTAFREGVVQEAVRTATGDQEFTAFNAALATADLPTVDLLMQRIDQQGVHPSVVLVEVSPETLAQRNRFIKPAILRHWTWLDVATRFDEVCRSGSVRDLLVSRLFPLCRYRADIRAAIARPWTPDAAVTANAPNKRGPHTVLPWEYSMQQARARGIPQSVLSQREMHVLRKWLKDYRIGGSTDQACERIVRRCRQRNIAVVLIAPPLSSDHRQCYTPQIEAAFLDRLRGLAERYACRFVDYRDRMPDTMFLDNHHLHLEGAQELSRQLVEEVLAPAWIAR